jgi:hypothetical protein
MVRITAYTSLLLLAGFTGVACRSSAKQDLPFVPWSLFEDGPVDRSLEVLTITTFAPTAAPTAAPTSWTTPVESEVSATTTVFFPLLACPALACLLVFRALILG